MNYKWFWTSDSFFQGGQMTRIAFNQKKKKIDILPIRCSFVVKLNVQWTTYLHKKCAYYTRILNKLYHITDLKIGSIVLFFFFFDNSRRWRMILLFKIRTNKSIGFWLDLNCFLKGVERKPTTIWPVLYSKPEPPVHYGSSVASLYLPSSYGHVLREPKIDITPGLQIS